MSEEIKRFKTAKERMLEDALEFCSLRALPEEATDDSIWIYAIAECLKADGSTAYVVLQANEYPFSRIIKDFGNVAMVAKITHIFPYIYLDKRYIPKFKDKADKVKFINNELNRVEVTNNSEDDVIRMNIARILISKQLAKMKGE